MVSADPECDLIMKGGITSGLVYPRAAAHLARRYRFRNLGGASAGAIAAAFAAAAEHGRQKQGFEKLDRIPSELGAQLATLFQPIPATAPMHEALLAFVAPDATTGSKVSAVWQALKKLAGRSLLIAFLLTGLLGAGLALLWQAIDRGPFDWWAAALNFLLWLPVCAVVAVGIGLWRALTSAMSRIEANGFGLCDGHSTTGPVPLTDWMHARLQDLAGLDPAGPPLTFGNLWGARAVQDYADIVKAGGELDLKPYRRSRLRHNRSIDLVLMTTNLTQRRPHRFPFETRQFFWCPSCFERYFPQRVREHLAATDGDGENPAATREVGVIGAKRTIAMTCPQHPATAVRHLPPPAQLPVLLAARFSLSFPGLISAVPLLFVDYGRKPEQVALVMAWFSDGGIASNFPMHLFDSPFPSRPTFGFDLQPTSAEHGDEPVAIPGRHGGGPSHLIDGVMGFAKAILETMQNWSDSTQLGMNTFSNRVPEIRLSNMEGGINLSMTSTVIDNLAKRGADAAALLDGFDLPAHQVDRAQMSLRLLDDLLTGMQEGFTQTIDGLNPTRAEATRRLFDLVASWGDAHPLSSGASPRLQADFRQTPRQ